MGKPHDGGESRVALAAFEQPELGAMQARLRGQALLGVARLLSQASQVRGELVAVVSHHAQFGRQLGAKSTDRTPSLCFHRAVELGGIVILVAIGALYAALIARAVVLLGRARVRPFVTRSEVAEAAGARAGRLLDELVGPLHHEGFRLARHGPDGARFERRYRPAWAILVALLFCWLLWPLLVLLVTRRAVIDVNVEPAGARTRITAAGSATSSAITVIEQALAAGGQR